MTNSIQPREKETAYSSMEVDESLSLPMVLSKPPVSLALAGLSDGTGSLLVQLDLSRPWDSHEGGPRMLFVDHGGMSTDPPALLREGGLFQDDNTDSALFVYGGSASNSTVGTPGPRSKSFVGNSLWSIIPSNGSWSSTDLNLEATHSPQHGASSQAAEQGLAFYFNGVIGVEESREPHTRMMVIDLRERKAKNVSTATISPSGARVGPTLQYIPGLGEKGVLILIGGGVIQNGGDTNTHELGSMMVREH
jgi:hypothetical protein